MTAQNEGKPDDGKPISEKTKEVAEAVSETAKEHAQDLSRTVVTEAKDYAGQAKDAAAGEVKNVASALRTAASELRSGSPQERTFGQIADTLADTSDALRDKDLGEMVGAINDFARRNPMLFLGSAALIGLAATRFAKASGGSPYPHAETYGLQSRQSAHPTATTPSGLPTGSTSAPSNTTTPKGGAV